MSQALIRLRHAVLMGACVVAFGTGCRPSFDVPVTSESTIEGQAFPAALIPINFANFAAMDLSTSQEFKNQGVSKDQVESVLLKSVTLEVTAPANGNFDFLNSIEFDVAKSESDTKVPIAEATSIPRGTKKLDLTVKGVELAPYVTAASMKVTTKVNGTPPTVDTTVKASLVFEVVPKIF